ncbi:MAG: 50S ribosomal protein L24 [Candidatus Marinimicrobia bacterium]|nr:50S ribosomal protein L24 [Candidatus Neomarinimicrobiota bacterium]MAV96192.1 50S ribosomal protein L24 [Candidatus Neomarinimicrobiota bacterium]|tara:strand:+ start:4623 stop:4931 length:309 start_codon:yes stop_codon:yes gene_type:complete
MHVKQGMLVKVISGNHKGQEGKILNVFPGQSRVIIEGVNFRKRASRPTQENPSGGFVEREAPIHISNVMIINNGKPTRIGYKVLEDGSKIRVSKKTNEEIES